MPKQFSGFTQQQTEVLARKMGFKGPMDQFKNFLRSDPANAQKFGAYEEQAKKMVASSTEKRGFANGGTVVTDFATSYNNNNGSSGGINPNDTTPSSGGQNHTTITPISSPGYDMSQDMIDNPEGYVTNVNVHEGQVSRDELINPNSGQVGANPDVVASGGHAAQADNPQATDAPTVETATVSGQVGDVLNNTQAAHGTVSGNSLVTAAQALPSENATVQGQLARLMSQFEGGNTPAWAAGAMRMANAAMASRGLGASSMAAGAVTQAAMESAISIAAQDAATFSAFEMQNLNNRQQARLQNAQAFLTMDIENLRNDQQTALFKSQAMIQSLFTDQAAENATRQFNATSQSQTDQFFASLSAQVGQFNASQQNAMRQFNVSERNRVSMFNRQQNDARDQFNASNRLIIDQSNATWRRAITTANNEAINEANRINAQAATGMTTAAYNNLMLREQDFYTFAFQAGQNALQRNHELVMSRMASRDANQTAAGQAVGSFVSNVITNMFGD